MRIFKFFADVLRKMGEDPKWLIVHREDTSLVLASNKDRIEADGYLHYDLYEDKNGNREVEVSFVGLKMAHHNTIKGRAQLHADVDEFYVEKAKPWKRGLRIMGIDSYEQADQRQSLEVLKGDNGVDS